jgi:hypothetical protein
LGINFKKYRLYDDLAKSGRQKGEGLIMGHKHADKYKQLAKDVEFSDTPWSFWQRFNLFTEKWEDCDEQDVLFLARYSYRRKPETVTITVNGRDFKLPKWETKAPEPEQDYFIIDGRQNDGVSEYEWENDYHDKANLRNKIVHLTKENVLEWVKLWQFMTGRDE